MRALVDACVFLETAQKVFVGGLLGVWTTEGSRAIQRRSARYSAGARLKDGARAANWRGGSHWCKAPVGLEVRAAERVPSRTSRDLFYFCSWFQSQLLPYS